MFLESSNVSRACIREYETPRSLSSIATAIDVYRITDGKYNSHIYTSKPDTESYILERPATTLNSRKLGTTI